MAGGPKAKLSSDNFLCVHVHRTQKNSAGFAGAFTGLRTGLEAQSGQCVSACVFIYYTVCLCVALCCGMLNRIKGDLVRSSWYQDHGTVARMCVSVCVVCVIGLAVTWCGTVGVVV